MGDDDGEAAFYKREYTLRIRKSDLEGINMKEFLRGLDRAVNEATDAYVDAEKLKAGTRAMRSNEVENSFKELMKSNPEAMKRAILKYQASLLLE